MKRNKNKVILSSIVVLLPMVIGLLIWNQLPKDVATHFGFNGQPDGYSSKEFAVFVLPLIIFVIHLFCIFAVSTDQNPKILMTRCIQLFCGFALWFQYLFVIVFMGIH